MHHYKNNLLRILFLGIAVLLLFLIPALPKSQNQQLRYKIIQGGDNIGWLQLNKKNSGDTSSLSLVSEIKKRFFLLITVSAKESAVYKGRQLIYSSQFRKNNDDTRLNKQTKFIAGRYEVEDEGEKQHLTYSFIGTNLLCLYFQEPVGINTVYCDNHSCFLNINKTEDGGYKVKFPDGNSNCFYYSNGICTKVVINHTFYTAQIILNL
jgi:hypothetical protein